MSNAQYLDYLKSNAWDKKRKARLKHDSYTCQRCGARNVPLDVHHKNYKRLGNERIGDLESLCRTCHDIEHGNRPDMVFNTCKTCGEFLLIFIERVKVLGTFWKRYTCQDGHVRLYRDDR